MTLKLWRKVLPASISRRIVQSGHCWEWRGGVNGNDFRGHWIGGYGYARVSNRMVRVHRFVYTLLAGEPGPLLHHVCRNRRCCRPNHLEPSTPSDNQKARWE